MAIKKYSSDEAANYLFNLFRTFQENAASDHRAWYMDSQDMECLPYNVSTLTSNAPFGRGLEASDPLNTQNVKESVMGWRSKVNFNIKVRPKFIAMLSQFLQIYANSEHEIPLEVSPTPLTDVEEFLSEFTAKEVIEAFMTPEEALVVIASMEGMTPEESQAVVVQAVQEAYVKQSKARIDRANRALQDMLTESKSKNVLTDCAKDYINFGKAVLKSPVITKKRRRKYRMKPVTGTSGQGMELLQESYFENVTVAGGKRIAPWHLYLDPDAAGDPQAGAAVVEESWVMPSELAKYKSVKGYDPENIDLVLQGYEANFEEEQNSKDVNVYNDSFKQGSSQTVQLLEFYFKATRKQLEKWGWDEILAEAEKDEYYQEPLVDKDGNVTMVSPEGEFATYDCRAILANNFLIFKSHTPIPEHTRPYQVALMLPGADANTGRGIWALARQVVLIMSEVMQRSIDNEKLAGTTAFAIMEGLITKPFSKIEPGMTIEIDGRRAMNRGLSIRDIFQQLQFSSTSQSLIAIFQIFDVILDEVTMITKNMVGITERGEQTAYELSSKLASAQTILETLFDDFDKGLVQPYGEQLYHYLQNSPDTPEDAKADGVVKSTGSRIYKIKALNKARMNEILAIAGQLPPEFLESINFRAIWEKILSSMDLDPRDVQYSEQVTDQITALKAQLQQAAAQMEQMGAQMGEMAKQNESLEKDNRRLKDKEIELDKEAPLKASNAMLKMQNESLKQIRQIEKVAQSVKERQNTNNAMNEKGV